MTRPPNGIRLADAVLLGTVQGLAEFLPVSSSAHLALLRRLLGVEHPRALDIALHLGSTAALLVVMRRDVLAQLQSFFTGAGSAPAGAIIAPAEGASLNDPGQATPPPGVLLLATLPAVVAGALLHGRLDGWERHPDRIAVALVGGSAALAAAALHVPPASRPPSNRISTAALVAGLGQAVALLPGVSRSGATISAAMLLGVDCARAARLSFLLAVPITLAANVRAARELRALTRNSGAGPLLLGATAAALAGLAGASTLSRWLSPRGLLLFALYRCALAAALLVVPRQPPRLHPPAPSPDVGRGGA